MEELTALPNGLKTSTIVTVTGGTGKKYCEKDSLVCDSDIPEPYAIIDAGRIDRYVPEMQLPAMIW